jgi:hypothetical protein
MVHRRNARGHGGPSCIIGVTQRDEVGAQPVGVASPIGVAAREQFGKRMGDDRRLARLAMSLVEAVVAPPGALGVAIQGEVVAIAIAAACR